jgi:hypothetical protein
MAAGRDLLRSAELSLNFLERRAIWHAVINNFWFNLDAGCPESIRAIGRAAG